MDNWIDRVFITTLSIFYLVLSVCGIIWIINTIKEWKRG